MNHTHAADLPGADVCVVGLGYVGVTLAVGLAEAGLRVLGYEARAEVCERLRRGELHLLEHGLEEGLRRHIGRSLQIVEQLPDTLPPAVVVSVGTPADDTSRQPELGQLESAIGAISARLRPDTLVVIRSTVPVGTCRRVVLPLLRQRVAAPLLAFCPERTIQGRALEELRSLPQIVGGASPTAVERACALFAPLAAHIIPVSSIEAAEMIKLICNAHTDLIYGFGNQVALIAETLGLNADELIASANLHYPRPDLCRPGFVGGSCLSKDPYLLMHSTELYGYTPPMVAAARQLNESVPYAVAQRVIAALKTSGRDLAQMKVCISGFAYKGQPETDDLRGGPSAPIVQALRAGGCYIVGHDFVVSPARIAALDIEPVSFEAGFSEADGVLVLNNHRSYAQQPIERLIGAMHRPALLYDAWGVYQDRFPTAPSDIQYLRLGHG